MLSRILTGLSTLLFCPWVHAEYALNMKPGVTALGRDIYDLHMIIFWVCVVIALLVFGIMIYTIIWHRKSRRPVADQFHEHLWVEIAWTVIPLLILVVMAVPATTTLLSMHDTDKSDLDIVVTGYQWKWKYDYLDSGIGFFSNLATPRAQIENKEAKNALYLYDVDRPLVVPIHKKIRFLFTANDVIHAWWVPDLAVKKDAVPGFIHESWARIEVPGTYRGQCAELCGKDHGFMPIVVEAKTQADYEAWVKAQLAEKEAQAQSSDREWTLGELVAHGEKVYSSQCVACHQANGQGVPNVFPSLVGTAVVKGPIETHLEKVINGVPNTSMQAFGKQLSDTDLAAVVTYERNAWGNNKGDLVQPRDIKNYKK